MTEDDENRVRAIIREAIEPPPRLLNFAAVGAMTSLSRSTIERLVDAGTFPQPVQITEGRCAFVRSEVEAWIRERVAARGGAD